jgi:hypothetical protein
VPDYIRIPSSTSRRGQPTFAKLLTRVDPSADNGFGFDGTFIRPGKLVPMATLWPTPEHPAAPLLLEYAGAIHPRRTHRRRGDEDLYVLWRFDPEARVWSEIVRTTARCWEWALVLRPVALRLLEEARAPDLEIVRDVESVVSHFSSLLDRVTDRLPSADRGRFLAELHDRFAVRLSALAA